MDYETALLYADQGSRQFILLSLAEVYRTSGKLDRAAATYEEYVNNPNVDPELSRFHIMLMRPDTPLLDGDYLPLTLTFVPGLEVTTQALDFR